jgi:hypothetical protein
LLCLIIRDKDHRSLKGFDIVFPKLGASVVYLNKQRGER